MSFVLLGILNSQAAGGGGVFGYDHLETVNLTSTTSSITFSNISQDYRHLEIKLVTKSAGSEESGILRFNNDGGNNYQWSFINAFGTGSNGQRGTGSGILYGYHDDDAFNSTVIEIPYYSGNKYKHLIHRGGAPGGAIRSGSGVWTNTSPITSITLRTSTSGSFTAGVTASLYGIG